MERTIEESVTTQSFSLFGGPLRHLGHRLGLVSGGTNTVALGLTLGILLWTVLAALALIEGVAHQVFALSVIGAHVRLLLIIPLFFICESYLGPRMTAFAGTIVRSGVVPKPAQAALESEIARVTRLTNSWLIEATCMLAAILLSLAGRDLVLSGTTSAYDSSRGSVTITGLWYWTVCLPLFRFLIIRWILRLGLWSYFLWRVSKLDLRLIATHPDRAGGLGYLAVVHDHFTPLVLAISAAQAAALSEEIYAGTATFEAVFPSLALVVIVDAILFIGPLLIFTPRLWACRVTAMCDYMEFAASYVRRFDKKWLKAAARPEEPLLGTADLQSLADLSNSVRNVRTMRVLPISVRLLVDLLIAAVLPMMPLFLFKYPIAELTRKLFTRLAGF